VIRQPLHGLIIAAVVAIAAPASGAGDLPAFLPPQPEPGSWHPRIHFSGEVEFLASRSEAAGKRRHAFEFDEAELTIDLQLAPRVAVSTTLEYDDGVSRDEAVLVLGGRDSPLTLTLGASWLPFGVINSSTWTDPLTEDFTDTTADIALLSARHGGLSGDLYLYRGAQDDVASASNLGLNLGYVFDSGIALGAGYLSNISATEPFGVDETVSALRLNGAIDLGDLMLSGEYIRTGRFDSADGARPAVAHLGADYGIDNLFGAPGLLALGYSTTDDARLLDLAQRRAVINLSRRLTEDIDLLVEYAREEDYREGVAEQLSLVLTTGPLQLALERYRDPDGNALSLSLAYNF